MSDIYTKPDTFLTVLQELILPEKLQALQDLNNDFFVTVMDERLETFKDDVKDVLFAPPENWTHTDIKHNLDGAADIIATHFDDYTRSECYPVLIKSWSKALANDRVGRNAFHDGVTRLRDLIAQDSDGDVQEKGYNALCELYTKKSVIHAMHAEDYLEDDLTNLLTVLAKDDSIVAHSFTQSLSNANLVNAVSADALGTWANNLYDMAETTTAINQKSIDDALSTPHTLHKLKNSNIFDITAHPALQAAVAAQALSSHVIS